MEVDVQVDSTRNKDVLADIIAWRYREGYFLEAVTQSGELGYTVIFTRNAPQIEVDDDESN